MRQLGYGSNKADPDLEVEEPIPPNAPKAIGKVVDLRMIVNSDHAGDQHTWRSCSGFLIYLNTSLLVLIMAVNYGNLYIWHRICGHEDRCRCPTWHML
ncbi:LOW QUALITY PROTEIN: hypothetical protein ACHAXS_007332 [Conticribra weissflogii]